MEHEKTKVGSEIVLRAEGISKEYYLEDSAAMSLKESMNRSLMQLARLRKLRRREKAKFLALDNITFDLRKGEILGLVGHNGAGKSTLLKILSQVTPPSSGRVIYEGKLTSLLEIGLGFHHELTGRENIFLNGSLMGMTKNQITEQFDHIVAFAGLEKFVNIPIKHYSTGMVARLGFSVLSHVDSEIMLLDEVLSVGDAEFQEASNQRIQEKIDRGRSIIMVSHELEAIRKMCHRCILLENGKMLKVGEPGEVIDYYLSRAMEEKSIEPAFKAKPKAAFSVVFASVRILDDKLRVSFGEPLVLEAELDFYQAEDNLELSLTVLNASGMPVFSSDHQVESSMTAAGKRVKYQVTIPPYTFVPGHFSFSWTIFRRGDRVIDYAKNVCPIEMINPAIMDQVETNKGEVYIQCEWAAEPVSSTIQSTPQ